MTGTSPPAEQLMPEGAAPKAAPRLRSADIARLGVAQLQALVTSPAHVAATLSRDYGDRDPLVEPGELVLRCKPDCAARLVYDVPSAKQLNQTAGDALRPGVGANFVRCQTCAQEGLPSLREWRAVVDWNFVRARAGQGDLENFPFFNLRGLTRKDALLKLESIHYDLSLRRALERKRLEAGEDVGRRFVAKLDAYLGWANIALTLARRKQPKRPAAALNARHDHRPVG